MIPEWLIQCLLAIVGILGGAIWYFLSQDKYYYALWVGFGTFVLLGLTATFYIQNSIAETGKRQNISPIQEAKENSINIGQITNSTVTINNNKKNIIINKSNNSEKLILKDYKQISKEYDITRTAVDNFFKSLGQGPIPIEELDEKLRNFSKTYKSLEKELKQLDPRNPSIVGLKNQAGEALEKGDFNNVTELIKAARIQYLSDTLDIIERNCESFHHGNYPDYRVVAAQLGILLNDKENGKNNSLALKIFPNLKLHPMKNRITKESLVKQSKDIQKIAPGAAAYPEIWIPHGITGVPEHVVFTNVFDLRAKPIPLEDWLDQIGVILGGRPFTLKDMINSVDERDGGRHIKDTPNEYLTKAREFHHKGEGRRLTGYHEPMIIAIGEYITSELRGRL